MARSEEDAKMSMKCYLVQPELTATRLCLSSYKSQSSYSNISAEEMNRKQTEAVSATAALLKRYRATIDTKVESVSYERAKCIAMQVPPPKDVMFIIPSSMWSAAIVNSLIVSRITVISTNAIKQMLEDSCNSSRADANAQPRWRSLSSSLLDLCLRNKTIYFDMKTLGREKYKVLMTKACQLDAHVEGCLHSGVDIILAAAVGSSAYYVNCSDPDLRKPVVHPSWLQSLFEQRKCADTRKMRDPFDAHFINEHRLKTFEGLQVCISGFSPTDNERSNIEQMLRDHGATYESSMRTDSCTHLICKTPEGPKFDAAKMWNTVVAVRPEWFEDSIKENFCMDWRPYAWLAGSQLDGIVLSYRSHVMTIADMENLDQRALTSSSAHSSDGKAGVDTHDGVKEPLSKKVRLDVPVKPTPSTSRKSVPHSTAHKSVLNSLPQFDVSSIVNMSPAVSSTINSSVVSSRGGNSARPLQKQLSAVPEESQPRQQNEDTTDAVARPNIHLNSELHAPFRAPAAVNPKDAVVGGNNVPKVFPSPAGSAESSSGSVTKNPVVAAPLKPVQNLSPFRNPMLEHLDIVMAEQACGSNRPQAAGVPAGTSMEPPRNPPASSTTLERAQSERFVRHASNVNDQPLATAGCMSSQIPKQGMIGYQDLVLEVAQKSRVARLARILAETKGAKQPQQQQADAAAPEIIVSNKRQPVPDGTAAPRSENINRDAAATAENNSADDDSPATDSCIDDGDESDNDEDEDDDDVVEVVAPTKPQLPAVAAVKNQPQPGARVNNNAGFVAPKAVNVSPKSAVAASSGMTFQLTGFSSSGDNCKQIVMDVIRKTCGAPLLDSDELKNETTHMLCKTISRTEKVLSCIGRGVMLLHPSYVDNCRKNQQLISGPVVEQRFEWATIIEQLLQQTAATSNVNNNNINNNDRENVREVALAARQWRGIIRETGQRPFTGLICALYMSAESRTAPFERVIQAAGGKCVHLFDRNTQKNMPFNKDLTVVFVDKNSATMPAVVSRYDELMRAGVHILNVEFITQFLTTTDPNHIDLMNYLFPAVRAQLSAFTRLPRMKPLYRAMPGHKRVDLSLQLQQRAAQQPPPPPQVVSNVARGSGGGAEVQNVTRPAEIKSAKKATKKVAHKA